MAVHRTVRVQHSATHPDRGAITLDGDTLTLVGEVDHGLVARWTAEAPADVTATTVDARAVTKVQGVPFSAGELETAFLKELGA